MINLTDTPTGSRIGVGSQPDQRLISIREAADFLGVSPRTLYGWIGQRRIPFRKAGRRVLFLSSELLEWTQPEADRNQLMQR